ncbi:MAG: hypothetical protein E7434_02840 [Ruminococcaceae bacterium]|nr:hypothetical protein [Oscillospiraceae bacterium]
MKLRKKALLPAIAMVLASVIALSGVTYAWFTTGNTATVESLDVNVQTANGIQISLDASSWRSTIDAEDIKTAITSATAYTDRVIQFPEGEIAPVSSAGNVSDGRLQMFNGAYNNDGTLMSAAVSDINGTQNVNYVAFDLFFKSSMEQVLTLKLADSFVACTDALGGDINANTDSAVRVAFLNLGSAATPAAARALKGDANTTAQIWEPNSTKRADGTTGAKLDYNGFNTAFAAIDEEALNDATVDGTAAVAAVSTFDETTELVTLSNGITKIRVYIWLEGQDVDCVNTISFGDFTTNLHFTVPEIEE